MVDTIPTTIPILSLIEPIRADLTSISDQSAKMSHVESAHLIAYGPTGAGKSSFLHRLISADDKGLPPGAFHYDPQYDPQDHAGRAADRADHVTGYAPTFELSPEHLGRRADPRQLKKTRRLTLACIDTGGHADYARLRGVVFGQDSAKHDFVLVLCFALDDRESFRACVETGGNDSFYDELDQYMPGGWEQSAGRVVLVGCKSDAAAAVLSEAAAGDGTSSGDEGGERADCVTIEEGIEAARRLGCARYMEFSCFADFPKQPYWDELALVAMQAHAGATRGEQASRSAGKSVLKRLFGRSSASNDDGEREGKAENEIDDLDQLTERELNLMAHGVGGDSLVFALRPSTDTAYKVKPARR